MAKAPKASDNTTPKKRTTKTKPAGENGTEVVEVVAAAPVQQTKSSHSIEEKIRARAYELFLQRGGHGGSPEQDWLRAVAEIHGQSPA